MFNSLTQWQWVAIAWLELVVAYGAYLYYLHRRAKNARKDEQ